MSLIQVRIAEEDSSHALQRLAEEDEPACVADIATGWWWASLPQVAYFCQASGGRERPSSIQTEPLPTDSRPVPTARFPVAPGRPRPETSPRIVRPAERGSRFLARVPAGSARPTAFAPTWRAHRMSCGVSPMTMMRSAGNVRSVNESDRPHRPRRGRDRDAVRRRRRTRNDARCRSATV